MTRIINNERFWILLFAITLISLWTPTFMARHSAIINNQRVWLLADDAMISMRYARNLAEGHGLVWNPGEYVEGYTNFLWVIYMAFIHWIGIPIIHTSLAIIITNLALGILTMVIMAHLIRFLGGTTIVLIFALLSFVANKSIMIWSTGGFEVMLLSFLFSWSILRVLQEAETAKPSLLTFLLASTMALVRADAIILTFLTYITAFMLNSKRKEVIVFSGVSLIITLSHILFRIWYYGQILPNTAYLKTQNFDGRLQVGLEYIWDFAKSYWILLLFSVAGTLVIREKRWYVLLLVIGSYIAYIGYVGGDAFGNNRFFVPIIPLVTVLAFVGLYYATYKKTRLLIAGGLMSLALYSSYVFFDYPYFLKPYAPLVRYTELGFFLRDNTPPDTRVAASAVGLLFYFSERYGIDFLGKVDAHIAHLPTTIGTRPGHNKFDMDYSIGQLQPDLIVSHWKWPEEVDKQIQLEETIATGGPPYSSAILFNSFFRERCLPNPLPTNTWVTLYLCDWSDEAE